MSSSRLAIGLVFLFGCVAGGIGSQLVAPPARAGTHPARWEYFCLRSANDQEAMNDLNKAGLAGFELVSATTVNDFNVAMYCMKRPLT
jgi:hypothetical protein